VGVHSYRKHDARLDSRLALLFGSEWDVHAFPVSTAICNLRAECSSPLDTVQRSYFADRDCRRMCDPWTRIVLNGGRYEELESHHRVVLCKSFDG
jgi:hypothetical protein